MNKLINNQGVQNKAKGVQNMAGDTKCDGHLAIFCIPTHFVGDTLSGATPGYILDSIRYRRLTVGRDIG